MSTRVKFKLRYVYAIPDRHGNDRLYFWRGKGHPRVRLTEPLGTAAFHQRYDELMRGNLPTLGPARPQERTLAWLCELYRRSHEFGRLAPSTQKNRRLMLDGMCSETVAPGERETFAQFPLDRLSTKAVKVLRDRKGQVPNMANNRLKVLRALFEWAKEQEHIRENPAREVAKLRVRSDGYHTWTIEEVERFEARHPLGTRARLALDLLLYSGSRRSDVIRLGRQHVRDGWLRFTQAKTKTPVELPILPGLQATLDVSPTGDLTFLITEQGKAFTSAGFGNWFRDRCTEAGLKGCTAHGLRKAAAARAAENGATASQLLAMFGWLNMREAERYTKAAQRKKLAGAALVLLKRPEAKQGT